MDEFCKMHDTDIKRLLEDASANAKEHESFRRRLSEHDEQINAIHQLTAAVQSLADSMAATKTTVDKIDKRVEAIEKEPGERWKKIAFEIIKAIVLTAVGAGIAHFGIQ